VLCSGWECCSRRPEHVYMGTVVCRQDERDKRTINFNLSTTESWLRLSTAADNKLNRFHRCRQFPRVHSALLSSHFTLVSSSSCVLTVVWLCRQSLGVGVAAVSTAVAAVSPTRTRPGEPEVSTTALIAGGAAALGAAVIMILVVIIVVRQTARSESFF